MPIGMKYMFAMLCSNPAATNAEIGDTIATTLSSTVRPPVASQMARQTSAFASTPRARTAVNEAGSWRRRLQGRCATAASPSRHHSAAVAITTTEKPIGVPDIDDRPIPEEASDRMRPRDDAHHDEVVAREQLRAGDEDEDQAERERDTGQPPGGSQAEGRPGRDRGGQEAPSAMNPPATSPSTTS